MPDPVRATKNGMLRAMMNTSSMEHMHKACIKVHENPQLQQVLKNEKFDLVIIDIFLNYCVLGMIPHFEAPSILLSTMGAPSMLSTAFGNRLPPSFDLDNFLSDSGKDGFIFFSLGSIVKAKDMPENYRKVFLNVFSRLKQRVIWKWETETMPDLPPNVKLSKWLPQQDVLGHPNIRLFMTHGGLLSTQESVYHGVPVLGLPVFGDQDLNVMQAERGGYAKMVEIVDITEERLESAILELLNNPTYAQKAQALSKL
ncbi:UDP-glucuronosyltransferase [Orchesella cincta]|uniref:UDP-glucuronosyltransferase n=1 Tax=Orchesella cincta TaxID=48709 RepID=A0A1D2M0R8_ORCCI|nr:UDP-glucuronosyltransferase [Orchesella cincta]